MIYIPEEVSLSFKFMLQLLTFPKTSRVPVFKAFASQLCQGGLQFLQIYEITNHLYLVDTSVDSSIITFKYSRMNENQTSKIYYSYSFQEIPPSTKIDL